MKAELLKHYRRLRAPRFSPYGKRQMWVQGARSAIQGARSAIQADQIKARWDDLDGYTCASYEAPSDPACGHAWEQGPVRLVCHPDEHCDLDYLLGDSYEPRHNPEIKPEILEQEREAYIARINQDGVWGYVAEYWNGADWQHAYSCFGFVGDDLEDSGYDTDLMSAAIEGYEQSLADQARALEATRPDMYGPAFYTWRDEAN